MAVDETLLESAIERSLCTVRLYQWAEATLSLGHFQPVEAAADPRFKGLAVVRRLSGGGAILHHHEVTYSCAIPAAHPVARAPAGLYDLAHHAIIGILADWGVDARMRGAARSDDAAVFLCFSRGDPRDIVLEGRKIVGSAQRRRRGAVLQHGSILLRRSEFAPEYPGLADLIPDWTVSLRDLARHTAFAIARRLSHQVSQGELSPDEQRRAAGLERERY